MTELRTRSSPTINETISLLLQRDLVSSEEVILGALRIVASTSRNRHVRIESAPTGFFVKYPEHLSPGSLGTTTNEARFLQVASRLDDRYRARLPRFVLYENEAHLLIVELLRSHRTFALHCSEHDYPQFPLGLCGRIGEALAELHVLLAADLAHFSQLSLKSTPPWASEIHRPALSNLGLVSSATLDVIRIVQQSPVIPEALGRFPRLWKPACVIHGDVKADNILIDAVEGDVPNVRLVDWEMVQVGDPLWDAAGFIQELLLLWIKHLPYGPDGDVEIALTGAKLPLVVIQAAIRRFWAEYTRGQGPRRTPTDHATHVVAHFVGVRLVQTAYEMTVHRPEIPAAVRFILQLSENILSDARSAATDILNIDVTDAAL